jgi:hypothetical protein
MWLATVAHAAAPPDVRRYEVSTARVSGWVNQSSLVLQEDSMIHPLTRMVLTACLW